MKDGVQEIVGKTITGIIIKEGQHSIKGQVFLIFEDDTSFEFWANSLIHGTSGICTGGAEWARAYIADTMRCVLDYHANLKSRQEPSALDRRWSEFLLEYAKETLPHKCGNVSNRSLRNAILFAMDAISNLKQYAIKECEECLQNRRFADMALDEIRKRVTLNRSRDENN